MKEIIGKQASKNGLKKSLSIAKARFLRWLKAITFIVHNFNQVQEIVNHQNDEIQEMRLLVNFLLRNTNRYIRRRWIRYLDRAQEAGIWDATIVKLHPTDKLPTQEQIDEYLNNDIPDRAVIGVDLALSDNEPIAITMDGEGNVQ